MGQSGSKKVHPLRKKAVKLPLDPGVYRFLDQEDRVLYVGKAKALRKRVLSYFNKNSQTEKTYVMLLQAKGLEFTITASENEALILESNLIKNLQPRYNVLLKDGKSYPYLHLSLDHKFPRLALFRGSIDGKKGRFFGPYPSVNAVRETLTWLQRIFPIRQCTDIQFSGRKRPCLQYQIKRCSGPCSSRVTEAHYGVWIREVTLFLQGKDRQLVARLKEKMWQVSKDLAFEEAAQLRDRLKALEYVQKRQGTGLKGHRDVDIMALVQNEGFTVVQVFFIRGGLNLGDRSHFPENTDGLSPETILSAFIQQYYLDRSPPAEILVNITVDQQQWLTEALTQKRGGVVKIHRPQRGATRQLLDLAHSNGKKALQRHLSNKASHGQVLTQLKEILALDRVPERIECYDISHIQDTDPVGSMIVYSQRGFEKSAYRKFSVDKEGLNDDTARMGHVLMRRFQRLKEQPDSGVWPDLVLLDGGRGQLNAALSVAEELQLDGLFMVAIAKGPDRNAGRERFFLPEQTEPLVLPVDSPALFLLQRIRDEAHRFAIGYHRLRRSKRQTRSVLDTVPGVGTKRKKALLAHFGSVAVMREASVEKLAELPGMSRKLAEKISRFLNETS
ncbi:MAG: excinuclease ABC subunit UvrC [Magnetococcales bacterium]|nr:excinuclease ABC subunit UvrC [Magnetococcales bacterium]